MPRRCTGHLRGVVGNDHAVEIVTVKNREDADHVHIAFVDKSFAIVRHFPHDIAEMNISDLVLFAVLLHRVVNVASVISASVPTQSSRALLRLGARSINLDTCEVGRPGAAAGALSAWEDRQDGRRAALPTARPRE